MPIMKYKFEKPSKKVYFYLVEHVTLNKEQTSISIMHNLRLRILEYFILLLLCSKRLLEPLQCLSFWL